MGLIELTRFGNQVGLDPVVVLHRFRSRQVVVWRASKVQAMYVNTLKAGATDIWEFTDEAYGRSVTVAPTRPQGTHKVYFGDDNGNSFIGSLRSDYLYGGGNDTLSGNKGDTGGDIYNALTTDADHKLEIAGHSLGGHLAMAFTTLFSGFASQATVFNAPGFKNNATNQTFFAALDGSVPTDGPIPIINVIADEAKTPAANRPNWEIAA